MKVNGGTTVNVAALRKEQVTLEGELAELDQQYATFEPDLSQLKKVKKIVDSVLDAWREPVSDAPAGEQKKQEEGQRRSILAQIAVKQQEIKEQEAERNRKKHQRQER